MPKTTKVKKKVSKPKAKVVKPGTDVSHIAAEDIIYYDSRAGHTMVIKDEQYTVISERDVVVVE